MAGLDTRPGSSTGVESRGRVGTLGMFIIDHFAAEERDGQLVPTDEGVIGGGGVYAMIAARMFLPAANCALIVDKGDDFPQAAEAQLQAYGEEMMWFRPRNGKTTRALNLYSGNAVGDGHQSFRYLAPQMRLTPRDYLLPPSPFASRPTRWLHVVCNTSRADEIAKELREIRGSQGHLDCRMIWEPLPMSCVHEELPKFRSLASQFAVISPNLLETQALLGLPSTAEDSMAELIRATKSLARELQSSHGAAPAIIVRAGKLGAYTISDNWEGHTPAFWTEEEQDRVVDATGGGNAYMGGLCAGLFLTVDDYQEASLYAAVAASFAIQQRGLPTLSRRGQQELWNGDGSTARLDAIRRRVAQQAARRS